jgi:hypothetical protein
MSKRASGAKKSAGKGVSKAKPKAFAKLPHMHTDVSKTRRGRPTIYQDLYPEVWVEIFDAYGGLEAFVLALGLRADQHSQVRKWARNLGTPSAVTRRLITAMAEAKGLRSPFKD